jgi:hypothetical protein
MVKMRKLAIYLGLITLIVLVGWQITSAAVSMSQPKAEAINSFSDSSPSVSADDTPQSKAEAVNSSGGSSSVVSSTPPVRQTWAKGDLNCDSKVNTRDVNPFVLALSNPAGYVAAFPNCEILNGDINNDNLVDFGDINPFIQVLKVGKADLNCDSKVNSQDVIPFVLALSNPAGYETTFPNCDILNADVNNGGLGDGKVDLDDINPFAILLINGWSF